MTIYNDYLHRKAVFNALNDIGGCGAPPESWADGWDKAIDAAIEAIEKLPNADVEPVKHGRWQEVGGTPKGQMFHCSICHKVAYFPQPTRDKTWKKQCPYTYCPNCGAKMDGKEVQE